MADPERRGPSKKRRGRGVFVNLANPKSKQGITTLNLKAREERWQ